MGCVHNFCDYYIFDLRIKFNRNIVFTSCFCTLYKHWKSNEIHSDNLLAVIILKAENVIYICERYIFVQLIRTDVIFFVIDQMHLLNIFNRNNKTVKHILLIT